MPNATKGLEQPLDEEQGKLGWGIRILSEKYSNIRACLFKSLILFRDREKS